MRNIGRPSLKTVLKTTTVAGLAAVMLSSGIPAQITQSFAAPVSVTAPQAPSFADVVSAVSPPSFPSASSRTHNLFPMTAVRSVSAAVASISFPMTIH